MRREAQLKRLAEETQGSLKTTAPVDYLPNAGVVESKSPEVTTTLAQGVAPRVDRYGMSRIRLHVACRSEMKSAIFARALLPTPIASVLPWESLALDRVQVERSDAHPCIGEPRNARQSVTGAINNEIPERGFPSYYCTARGAWARGAMGLTMSEQDDASLSSSSRGPECRTRSATQPSWGGGPDVIRIHVFVQMQTILVNNLR